MPPEAVKVAPIDERQKSNSQVMDRRTIGTRRRESNTRARQPRLYGRSGVLPIDTNARNASAVRTSSLLRRAGSTSTRPSVSTGWISPGIAMEAATAGRNRR